MYMIFFAEKTVADAVMYIRLLPS